MLEDEVLVVIYRSLRDSISNNIAHVSFDDDKKIIYLTLKNKSIPYPYKGEEESRPGLSFSETIWSISKDGLSSSSTQTSAVINKKKKSWFKRLFK